MWLLTYPLGVSYSIHRSGANPPPATGEAGREGAFKMSEVKEVQDVSDQTFDADVLKSEVPVLVDFWAPWCGPCRMVAPIVKELSGEYEGKVSFRKMNTDENPMVAAKYNIRSIPTLLLFKGGSQVGQIVGFRPKNAIKERIDAALA